MEGSFQYFEFQFQLYLSVSFETSGSNNSAMLYLFQRATLEEDEDFCKAVAKSTRAPKLSW